MNNFKSGFVAILGRPNVGKSTLMNAMIGDKVAIVSPKPQTTRNRLMGVLTKPEFQIVFLDTPGIHRPKNKLGDYMVKSAEDAAKDVDAILVVVDAKSGVGPNDRIIYQNAAARRVPVVVAVNKSDVCSEEELLKALSAFSDAPEQVEILPTSGKTGRGLEELMGLLEGYLPEGPHYFPEDMITDQPEQAVVAELIREKALMLLEEEVPHGIGVEILSFKKRENQDLVDIQATIYCERESHKRIVIGKNGAMLKKIGSMARPDIERVLGNRVYLELWVKVKEDWRNKMSVLRTLGYE